MKLHCCVAAYVSDYAFLGTALLPYPNYRAKFSASLDHAMWFHSTFRSDEWMLYECESPWAGQYVSCLSACSSFVLSTSAPHIDHFNHTNLKTHNAELLICFPSQNVLARDLMCSFWFCHTGGCRGLVQGRLWRKDGVLAASCSQEGVLRVKPATQPSKL